MLYGHSRNKQITLLFNNLSIIYLICHTIIVSIFVRPQASQPSTSIASFHRWIRSPGSSFHVPRPPRWIQVYRVFAQPGSIYIQCLRMKKEYVNKDREINFIIISLFLSSRKKRYCVQHYYSLFPISRLNIAFNNFRDVIFWRLLYLLFNYTTIFRCL